MKVSLSFEESKREVDLEDILPVGYEKALQHCKACGNCCRRAVLENEAFAGIEQ